MQACTTSDRSRRRGAFSVTRRRHVELARTLCAAARSRPACRIRASSSSDGRAASAGLAAARSPCAPSAGRYPILQRQHRPDHHAHAGGKLQRRALFDGGKGEAFARVHGMGVSCCAPAEPYFPLIPAQAGNPGPIPDPACRFGSQLARGRADTNYTGAFGPAFINQSTICDPVQNSTSFFFLIFWKICRKYLARCGAPMM